jgi:hypothetical protein
VVISLVSTFDDVGKVGGASIPYSFLSIFSDNFASTEFLLVLCFFYTFYFLLLRNPNNASSAFPLGE